MGHYRVVLGGGHSIVVVKSLLQLRPTENKDLIPRLAALFDRMKVRFGISRSNIIYWDAVFV